MKDFRKLKDMAIKPRTHPAFFMTFSPFSLKKPFPLFRALMDCLVLPIQNKLEEWKKITHALDKEHAKGKPLAYYLGNDRVCNFLRVWRSMNESNQISKNFDGGCLR